MTTLATGELSGFDDDRFRVGRQHVLGKGAARLTANEVAPANERGPERAAATMSPVVGLVQRQEMQVEVAQDPLFSPINLWEVVIGDAKATPAEIKETISHFLDEAVAGEQLTPTQAEALWLELVDGQDIADMEPGERDAMMKRIYDTYDGLSDASQFAAQSEYITPFVKYTRATKDRGPKTIPEIQEDLNRLETGRTRVRREKVVLQVAGVMQVVLGASGTAERQ